MHGITVEYNLTEILCSKCSKRQNKSNSIDAVSKWIVETGKYNKTKQMEKEKNKQYEQEIANIY